MDSRLVPVEALSQVAFIHDYFQLVFQEERFTVYNRAAVADGENVVRQGSVGFCDKLVELIGQSVVAVTQTNTYVLCLRFSGGATLQVEADHDPSWPEAFDFIGRSQFWHKTHLAEYPVHDIELAPEPSADSLRRSRKGELRYPDREPSEGWLASNAAQRSRRKACNSLIAGDS